MCKGRYLRWVVCKRLACKGGGKYEGWCVCVCVCVCECVCLKGRYVRWGGIQEMVGKRLVCSRWYVLGWCVMSDLSSASRVVWSVPELSMKAE